MSDNTRSLISDPTSIPDINVFPGVKAENGGEQLTSHSASKQESSMDDAEVVQRQVVFVGEHDFQGLKL